MPETGVAYEAYDPAEEAYLLSFQSLVNRLVEIIGRKLTAYIGSVPDTEEVEAWEKGARPSEDIERRLRFTYRVAKEISARFGPTTAQAWLQGVNPELDDRVALQLIRESDLLAVGSEIIDAEHAFLDH
jgi:hypothetical protein